MSLLFRRWNRLEFLLLGAFVFACSDGGAGCDSGCGCGDSGGEAGPAYEFAGNVDQHVVHQGGQVHVTQQGLDTIATNIGPLVGSLLGDGGLVFCVPPTDVGVGTLCDDSTCEGEPGCELEVGLSDVFVIPERTDDPASDRIRIELNLLMDESLGLDLGWLGSCDINISDGGDGVPVAANAYLVVDPPEWEQTHAQLPPEELEFSTDDLQIDITGGISCFFADLLVPVLSGVFEDQLIGPLNDALGPALCSQCVTTEDCPGGSSCNGDGICQFDGSDECVPLNLGVEMEVAIGDLLSDFAPGLEANMGVLAYAANYADSFGPPGSGFEVEGVDLGLQLGFFAEQNPCVPYFPPPDTARYPKSAEINANETPAGAPFGVGIGVSRNSLNLAGWAAYRSGALCLSIGSDTVEQLSAGTFSVLMPSLGALTGGGNAPIYLQLRPQRPPVVDLGLGTVADDGTVEDPLLTLRIPELEIDFYVFAEDRYVRFLTLDTDVAVPLTLDVNDENQIVILLGDLSEAITRIEAKNDEILAEGDAGAITVLLPSLIGSLAPSLLGDGLAPIDIPELLDGVTIAIPPGGFTSVDDRQMLAIYADILVTGSEKSGSLQPLIVAEEIERSSPVELARMFARVRAREIALDVEALIPTVRLEMDTIGPAATGLPFEYSYRINSGAWSYWRQGDVLEIRDPITALSGTYTIDVQTRLAGQTHSASANVASTSLTVDYVPPTVAVEVDGDRVLVRAEDLHSGEPVTGRTRLANGSWSAFTDVAELDIAGIEGGTVALDVIATDAFGNETTKALTVDVPGASAVPFGTSTPVRPGSAEAGCTSSRSGTPVWPAIALLGLLGFRRRPRHLGLTAVAMLTLALVACGNNKSSGGASNACDPACEDGFACDRGECVSEDACDTTEDCEGGLVCEAGSCVEPCECPEGQECDEAGGCVPTLTLCETTDDCGDLQVCEEGECVDVACVEDTDCSCDEGVPVCLNNDCGCEPACGGACDDGFGCCHETDECVEITVECGEGSCDIGFGLVASGDPVWDPSTCEATIECACEELPPLDWGAIGEYLDLGISADKEMAAIAAYNDTYGDLMVGVISGDEIAWQFVAGVPDGGDVEGSLNGPRGGIADSGDDVGRYPSIAFDADGNAHVAFYAMTGDGGRALNYARGAAGDDGFTWSVSVLDATNRAGHYTDIEIGPDGAPVIAYAVPALRDEETNGYESQIRVIRADSAAADTWGEPVVLVRRALEVPCGYSCVGSQVCRADLDICQREGRDSLCDPECGDGESCFENEDGGAVCAALAEPQAGVPVLYYGIGVFLDAEFLPSGEYAVAYLDHTSGNLMYASTDGAAIAPAEAVILDGEVADADGLPVDTGDVGWYPDLYADDENVLVSYADATMGTLRVADVMGGVIYPVDDGVRCYEPDPDSGGCLQPLVLRVGYDSAIAPDADGMLQVVYQDATWHEVLESPNTEFGWDLPGTIATGGDPYTGAYGFYLAHGEDAEGRFVVSHRINQRAEPATRDVVVIRR